MKALKVISGLASILALIFLLCAFLTSQIHFDINEGLNIIARLLIIMGLCLSIWSWRTKDSDESAFIGGLGTCGYIVSIFITFWSREYQSLAFTSFNVAFLMFSGCAAITRMALDIYRLITWAYCGIRNFFVIGGSATR